MAGAPSQLPAASVVAPAVHQQPQTEGSPRSKRQRTCPEQPFQATTADQGIPAPPTPPIDADAYVEDLRPRVTAGLVEAMTLSRSAVGVLELGLQTDARHGHSIQDADCQVKPLFPTVNTYLAELLKALGLRFNWSSVDIYFTIQWMGFQQSPRQLVQQQSSRQWLAVQLRSYRGFRAANPTQEASV